MFKNVSQRSLFWNKTFLVRLNDESANRWATQGCQVFYEFIRWFVVEKKSLNQSADEMHRDVWE